MPTARSTISSTHMETTTTTVMAIGRISAGCGVCVYWGGVRGGEASLVSMYYYIHRVVTLCMYVPGVCVGVLVDIVDGVPLVDSDEAMLVGVWPCVAVLVGKMDGVLVVGSVVINTVHTRNCNV